MSKKYMTVAVRKNVSEILIIEKRKVIFRQIFNYGYGKAGDRESALSRIFSEYGGKKYPAVMSLPDDKCVYKSIKTDLSGNKLKKHVQSELSEFIGEDAERYLFEYMYLGERKNSVKFAAAAKKEEVLELKNTLGAFGIRLIKLVPETAALLRAAKYEAERSRPVIGDFREDGVILRFFDGEGNAARFETEKTGGDPAGYFSEIKNALEYYEAKGITKKDSQVYLTGEETLNADFVRTFMKETGRPCKSIGALIPAEISLADAAISPYETGAIFQ